MRKKKSLQKPPNSNPDNLPEWETKLRTLRDQRHVVDYNQLPSLASEVATTGMAEALANPEQAEIIKLRAAVAMAHVLCGKI